MLFPFDYRVMETVATMTNKNVGKDGSFVLAFLLLLSDGEWPLTTDGCIIVVICSMIAILRTRQVDRVMGVETSEWR